MESKYIAYDILETVKNMVVNYSIALNEASSEFIYKEIKKQFDELSMYAKELFNYAYEQNWYTLENVADKKLETTISKLSKELEE